jgi:hypothetical protein
MLQKTKMPNANNGVVMCVCVCRISMMREMHTHTHTHRRLYLASRSGLEWWPTFIGARLKATIASPRYTYRQHSQLLVVLRRLLRRPWPCPCVSAGDDIMSRMRMMRRMMMMMMRCAGVPCPVYTMV